MSFTEQLDSGMNTELSITNESKGFLLTACKWAKFLAIVGFVGIGLLVIVAIAILFIGFAPGGFDSPFGGMPVMMMLIYLILALFYFFPTLYLYRFAVLTKRGIENTSSDLVTTGFENLKACFKFVGVTMAIILGFYAAMLGIGLLTAMAGF